MKPRQVDDHIADNADNAHGGAHRTDSWLKLPCIEAKWPHSGARRYSNRECAGEGVVPLSALADQSYR